MVEKRSHDMDYNSNMYKVEQYLLVTTTKVSTYEWNVKSNGTNYGWLNAPTWPICTHCMTVELHTIFTSYATNCDYFKVLNHSVNNLTPKLTDLNLHYQESKYKLLNYWNLCFRCLLDKVSSSYTKKCSGLYLGCVA